MTALECLNHPLWHDFELFMLRRDDLRMIVASSTEQWMPYWEVFLEGTKFEGKRIMEKK